MELLERKNKIYEIKNSLSKTHEKMLNISNYQRNANQNYNEVPPHTGLNGHHEKVYK